MSKTIKLALSVLLCITLLFGAVLPMSVFGTDAATSILSAGPEGNVLAGTKAKVTLSVTAKDDVSEIKLVQQGGSTEIWAVGSTGVTVADNGDGSKTWTKKQNFSEGVYSYTAYAKTGADFEAAGVDFTVNAVSKSVTITLANTGIGTLTAYYNGGTKKSVSTSTKLTVAVGDVVTLVAKPTTMNGCTYEFLFWNNKYTSRMIGSDTTLKLEAVTDMNLESQFSPNSLKLSETNKFVVYTNLAGNILKNIELSKDEATGAYKTNEGNLFDDSVVPTGPVLQDHQFAGWSMTPAEITASEKRTVIVTPTYTMVEEYTVTIPQGDYEAYGAGTYTCRNNERALVNIGASAQNDAGQAFQYWLDCDTNEVVTYARSYLFYAVKNTTLRPVYGDEAVAPQPVIRIAALKFSNARANFFVERSVPNGYEVVQSGIVVTKDQTTGENEAALVIGNGNAVKGTSVNTSADGFYTAVVKLDKGKTVWGRGYLIYRDAAGNICTIYSPISSYNY